MQGNTLGYRLSIYRGSTGKRTGKFLDEHDPMALASNQLCSGTAVLPLRLETAN